MRHSSLPAQETFAFEFRDTTTAAAQSLEPMARTTVESCYRRAEKHFQRRFERPLLSFKLRGMAAAVAYPGKNAIRINGHLLQQNTEDFIASTIPHEVSHLLAYCLHGHGIAPHGAEWAAIMREVFGLAPRRCHDYDVRPSMTTAFQYHCGCQAGHALSARRHHSALRGRRYYCRRCRQVLRYAHCQTSDGNQSAPD